MYGELIDIMGSESKRLELTENVLDFTAPFDDRKCCIFVLAFFRGAQSGLIELQEGAIVGIEWWIGEIGFQSAKIIVFSNVEIATFG